MLFTKFHHDAHPLKAISGILFCENSLLPAHRRLCPHHVRQKIGLHGGRDEGMEEVDGDRLPDRLRTRYNKKKRKVVRGGRFELPTPTVSV